MRAIWSFWSKPHYARRRYAWPSEFHHALAWSLSVQEASRHYLDTWLYTDDDGARLLVDRLHLPFAHVRTDLNSLDEHDPDWWALGKLYAYRLQTEPFVHIDCDVFLWLPLPEWLTGADVFAQNPEAFSSGFCWYRPEHVEQALAGSRGWLPDEWRWFRASRRSLRGECCGVLGGNRPDFIRYVADRAFEVIERQDNRAAMARINGKMSLMVVLEQFLLAACIEYHQHGGSSSAFRGLTMAYLFNSSADLFNAEHTARVGYTHLLGDTKRNPAVARLLERRVLLDDPDQYERCKKYLRA
jgi:hypothetical protein